MQFPVSRGPTKPGMPEAMQSLRSSRSDTMMQCFHGSLASRTHQPQIDADTQKLLYCFRHFKEVRNAIVHRNGRANKWNCAIQSQYTQNVSDLSALIGRGSARELSCHVLEGNQVQLSLRSVAAFGSVLMRLLTAWETEAACTIGGEVILSHRIRKQTRDRRRRPNSYTQKELRSFCHNARLANPVDYHRFAKFIEDRHL